MPEEENNGQLKPVLKGNIKFDHANLRYTDGTHAIKDFCLDIKAGQTIALVGRSGAGKPH
jgi:subfamily B ATP-binding cassette protein MsbA